MDPKWYPATAVRSAAVSSSLLSPRMNSWPIRWASSSEARVRATHDAAAVGEALGRADGLVVGRDDGGAEAGPLAEASPGDSSEEGEVDPVPTGPEGGGEVVEAQPARRRATAPIASRRASDGRQETGGMIRSTPP
jgi:hypothetical protein